MVHKSRKQTPAKVSIVIARINVETQLVTLFPWVYNKEICV